MLYMLVSVFCEAVEILRLGETLTPTQIESGQLDSILNITEYYLSHYRFNTEVYFFLFVIYVKS